MFLVPTFIFPFHVVRVGRNVPDMVGLKKLLPVLLDDKTKTDFGNVRPLVAPTCFPNVRRELFSFLVPIFGSAAANNSGS